MKNREDESLPKTLNKIPQVVLEKNGQTPFRFASEYVKPIQEPKNLETN